MAAFTYYDEFSPIHALSRKEVVSGGVAESDDQSLRRHTASLKAKAKPGWKGERFKARVARRKKRRAGEKAGRKAARK